MLLTDELRDYLDSLAQDAHEGCILGGKAMAFMALFVQPTIACRLLGLADIAAPSDFLACEGSGMGLSSLQDVGTTVARRYRHELLCTVHVLVGLIDERAAELESPWTRLSELWRSAHPTLTGRQRRLLEFAEREGETRWARRLSSLRGPIPATLAEARARACAYLDSEYYPYRRDQYARFMARKKRADDMALLHFLVSLQPSSLDWGV